MANHIIKSFVSKLLLVSTLITRPKHFLVYGYETRLHHLEQVVLIKILLLFFLFQLNDLVVMGGSREGVGVF